MNINLIEDCSKEYEKVIFISEKSFNELEVSEDIRKQLLTINDYIEYSYNTYDNEFKAYTIYHIKERFIDKNKRITYKG